jgi:hypothetical protein
MLAQVINGLSFFLATNTGKLTSVFNDSIFRINVNKITLHLLNFHNFVKNTKKYIGIWCES